MHHALRVELQLYAAYGETRMGRIGPAPDHVCLATIQRWATEPTSYM